MKNAIGNLKRSALNLEIALGSIVILTTLTFLVQEHFHLILPSMISFTGVLQSSEYRYFAT